jgi:ATP-dependent protease ClpP protease subunit
MKKLLMASVAVVTMMVTVPGNAAQIWVNPAEGHGHVIHIKGDIEKGDVNRFASAVGKAEVRPGDATVWLDSPGGLVMEGIPIARAIKKYGWSTYVAADTECTSMCAIIWLAGHTRFINSNGKVGFHSASDRRRPGTRNEQANAMMMLVYRDLGVSDKAARVFVAAEPGSDAIWLTADLAESLGIKAVTLTPDSEKAHTQPIPETNKVAVAPSLAQEPGQKTLQNIAEAPEVVEAPAKEAGDAGPPPVKAEDIISKPEPQHVEREQPRHRAERPHYRRIAHGYGGRVCAFSMPVPYIGGITIRGRC